jgi:ClpP class serine protease
VSRSVYVPHYAMSGGTLIALAADRIVLSPSAVLGPVDPQLGEYAAASILAAVGQKDANETDDKTLILADVARKAQAQVREFVCGLLRRRMDDARAGEIAAILSDGRWTHDFPIDAELARSFGLKVETDLPDEVRLLMRLYPQPRNRRPSVEYLPFPYDDRRPDRREPSRRLPDLVWPGRWRRPWRPSPRGPAAAVGRTGPLQAGPRSAVGRSRR